MNWPGYNYLGSGNPLNNGTPVNSVDAVAREHGIAYSERETYSDIVNADKIAIEKFRVEYEKSGKLTAKVGELGLRVKTTVEKGVGRTLYPWNMPKQSSPSTSNRNVPYGLSKKGKPLNRGQYLYSLRVKKAAGGALPEAFVSDSDIEGDENIDPEESVDTVDTAMEIQSDQPAVQSSGPSHPPSTSSSSGIQYLSNSPPNVQRVTFKRSRYMKTWGNKIKYFETPENKDAKSPTQYTTSMAWLPVELK